jgi:hypothetical protein
MMSRAVQCNRSYGTWATFFHKRTGPRHLSRRRTLPICSFHHRWSLACDCLNPYSKEWLSLGLAK